MNQRASADALRILLVEDSSVAAEIVMRRLGASEWPGIEIIHVASLEGAEAVLAEPWSVVLLDLGLPGCEDLEALTLMRARAPHLPIVVLTGHDDFDLAMRALAAEAQDYLVKWRIDSDALVRSIRYAIGRHQMLGRLARAVEEARASEASLAQITARSADGIAVVGPDGKVVFVNPAAVDLLGHSAESLLGQPLPHVDLGREEAEVVLERRRDRLVLDVRVVDVEWQGEASRMALMRDVTARRRSEELRVQLERSDRLAAVGQLAAGVAHEINNPLTYVTVNIDLAKRDLQQLARDGVDTSITLRRLAEAREGASRVVRIVRDLGMFSRVDPNAEARPVDVNAAVGSALNMAASHIKYRASVRRSFADLPRVLASEGRLSQVFLNLLVNAGQAIAEGHAAANRIEVRTFSVGDEIVVEVQDTGHGIPEENLARLFEPFFTTKRVGEGSGLGLSICRSILEAYGGRIVAESELGVGTCMRVVLPAWHGDEPPPRSAERDLAPLPTRRGRILLVDDEPAILRVLVELLSGEHEVVTSISGEEARTLLSFDEDFDLVLCDMVMDDGTGIELYRRMEGDHPHLAPRVVFMTGGVMTAEAKEFLAHNTDRMLPKPVEPEALQRLLEQVLGRAERASA